MSEENAVGYIFWSHKRRDEDAYIYYTYIYKHGNHEYMDACCCGIFFFAIFHAKGIQSERNLYLIFM